jgi:hypothetical protein
VLIFYALTVLVVDSLFAAVFSSVSLSYNSFSLASTLTVSLVPIPLNLYIFVFILSISFAFYVNSVLSCLSLRTVCRFYMPRYAILNSFRTFFFPTTTTYASSSICCFYMPRRYLRVPSLFSSYHFILNLINPLRSLFSVLYLLSITYSNYFIFLFEFISFSSAPAYSTRFAFLYAFIPALILALLLL